MIPVERQRFSDRPSIIIHGNLHGWIALCLFKELDQKLLSVYIDFIRVHHIVIIPLLNSLATVQPPTLVAVNDKHEIASQIVNYKNPNSKHQTNSNDQNSNFQTYLPIILKKDQPNDLVIGYWDLGFFCILVLGI